MLTAIGVTAVFIIVPVACYELYAFMDWVQVNAVTTSPAKRRYLRCFHMLPWKQPTSFDQYLIEARKE